MSKNANGFKKIELIFLRLKAILSISKEFKKYTNVLIYIYTSHDILWQQGD